MATMKMIEPWLFELRHIMKNGEPSVQYYAKFSSWNRIPLTKPLGDDLEKARDKIKTLRDLNALKRDDVRVELDDERKLRESLEQRAKEKEQARKGMTFAEWSQRYFKELVPPEKRASTVHQEELRIKTLNEHFGDTPLCEINFDMIRQYRQARAGQVGLATANLAVGFLRYLLNVAADHGALDSVPRIKLPTEKDRPHQRSVHWDEYQLTLTNMNQPHQREQQRVVVAWWETGMRHKEALYLTWPMVDFKAGLLRLPAEILKERSPRRTRFLFELRVILDELKLEQSKVANLSGFVFTRKDGRPIKNLSHALDLALRRAKLLNDKTPKHQRITPHSFRRAAITRWTDAGIPRDIVMTISGHKPQGVHDGYILLTDAQLVDHFRSKGLLSPPSERRQQRVVAGGSL